jgi:PKD repeat protein
MIRYRTDGTFPQNTANGFPIPIGNHGKIAGSPGLRMSYVHTNLDLTKSYHYSAFSYDKSNNFSQTAHAFAQPLSSDPNSPVISSFSATPSTLNNPGGTTTFSVSATDPNGDTLTYTINFGDGTASGSGSQVMHTYATPGTYTTTVTVSDGNGNSAGQSLQVTVNDLPPTSPKNVSAN